MISSRHLAYLDAMDISVWCLRETAAVASPASSQAAPDVSPGLKLGPGGGGVLLLCATDDQTSGRLASDISRALGSVPVWAWPDPESNAVKLADAVDENLFTTVAIFGEELAEKFFGNEQPHSISGAKLVILPAMDNIQCRAEARRGLWATLCRAGMVTH